jgi:hypothetical protein
MKEVVKMATKKNKKLEKIKIWVKNEFEEWDSAKRIEYSGYKIEDEDFYELVRELLKMTKYSDYTITGIYKTSEHGIIIRLFKQIENQYGGYSGSVLTFVFLKDIIKVIKGGVKNG